MFGVQAKLNHWDYTWTAMLINYLISITRLKLNIVIKLNSVPC